MSAADRRLLILDAARATFIEAGEASAVSLRMIAKRSGIDEALIYRHFGTKERLYAEAITGPVKAIVAGFEQRVRTAALETPASDGVRREWELTYGLLVALLSVPRDIARAFGMLFFGNPATAQELWNESLGPALETIEELVQRELPNWAHAEFVPSVAVRLSLAAPFWYVTEADITGRPLDVKVVATELTNRIFYGMVRRSAD